MKVALPPWGMVTDVPDGKISFHAEGECASEYCPLHNPSPHHMRHWPLLLRADLPVMLLERTCEHGVGHPDPDSLRYITEAFAEGDSYAVHGCDNCCHSPFTFDPDMEAYVSA